VVKVEVVLKDLGAKENGAKMCVTWKYSLTHPRTKLQKNCLWIGGSCWVKNIKLELVVKAWTYKKIPLSSFPNYLAEYIYVESSFPYA
jgi:hypothetical protein